MENNLNTGLKPNTKAAKWTKRDTDKLNNEQGIQFAVKASKNKKPFELDQIEKAALQSLKKGSLKVLKPSNTEIPEGYYSK